MAGSAHFDTDWSALDDIAPDLRKYLSIPNLRPLLRARHLLTGDELEKVEISSANPTTQAIDRFVSILKTKCPNHAEVFLEVLQLSLEQEDYHLGHEFLSKKLETVIIGSARERGRSEGDRSLDDERDLREVVRQIPIPDHPVARQNDSGLGLHGLVSSSEGSSQDTGSPPSAYSYSGASVASNGNGLSRPMRHLRVRVLRNVESDSAMAPQGLDERQVSALKSKIIRDTDNIIGRFAVMVVGVYRLLKQNNTPVDEVRIMLKFLGCKTSKTQSSTLSVTMFSDSDEISKSKDLAGLIECLRNYSSWYNYRLMKRVAEEFAGDDGKKLITDYEADLRKHYANLISFQCPDFTLEEGIPPGYTRLIVKVDWDFMFTNLQDVATFEVNLADVLELEPYVFQLRSVEEGCVRLEWALPAALEPHVAEIMCEKEECLRELRVLFVEILTAPHARVLISKHLHSPKESKGGLGSSGLSSSGLCPSHTACKQSLSSCSSIISILDQPMSSDEAELLSLYDSGGSRAASMHEESGLPCIPMPNFDDYLGNDGAKAGGGDGWEGDSLERDGDGIHSDYCQHYRGDTTLDCHSERVCVGHTEGGSSHGDSVHGRPSGSYFTRGRHRQSSTNLAVPERTPVHVRRVCVSESNLLSAGQQPPLQRTQEGRSLPSITGYQRVLVGSGGANRTRTRNGIVRKLKKIPRSIFHLLFFSEKRKREEKEGTLYCNSPTLLPIPFPLFNLSEEPRKIGSVRDVSQNLPVLEIEDLHHSQRAHERADFEVLQPFSDTRRDSAFPCSPPLPPIGLQVDVLGQRRDSAVPSSPSSSISFMDNLAPVVARPKQQDQDNGPLSNRDSGGGSFESDTSRANVEQYERQTSTESADTVSLGSVSTQLPSNSKRNSYSSHYYVNINTIAEHPDDTCAGEVESTWSTYDDDDPDSPSTATETMDHRVSPPDEFETRIRSCSLNDNYVRNVHGNSRLQSSQQSSGYSSYASSMAHVDAAVMQSEESLSDEACGGGKMHSMATPTRGPRNYAQTSVPFQSAPWSPANVRRGGSLKASVKLATYVAKSPFKM